MSKERRIIHEGEVRAKERIIKYRIPKHPGIVYILPVYLQDRAQVIMEHGKEKIANSEPLYPHNDVVKASETQCIGPLIHIDRRFLYGIQTARENFERNSTAQVIADFENNPDFFYKNPACVCFMPLRGGSSKLIVVDGHHRIRNSSRVMRIDETGKLTPHYPLIPARVFTFSQWVDLINTSIEGEEVILGGNKYTEETFKDKALLKAAFVEKEMERYIKPENMPIPLYGTSSIDELVTKYGVK